MSAYIKAAATTVRDSTNILFQRISPFANDAPLETHPDATTQKAPLKSVNAQRFPIEFPSAGEKKALSGLKGLSEKFEPQFNAEFLAAYRKAGIGITENEQFIDNKLSRFLNRPDNTILNGVKELFSKLTHDEKLLLFVAAMQIEFNDVKRIRHDGVFKLPQNKGFDVARASRIVSRDPYVRQYLGRCKSREDLKMPDVNYRESDPLAGKGLRPKITDKNAPLRLDQHSEEDHLGGHGITALLLISMRQLEAPSTISPIVNALNPHATKRREEMFAEGMGRPVSNPVGRTTPEIPACPFQIAAADKIKQFPMYVSMEVDGKNIDTAARVFTQEGNDECLMHYENHTKSTPQQECAVFSIDNPPVNGSKPIPVRSSTNLKGMFSEWSNAN